MVDDYPMCVSRSIEIIPRCASAYPRNTMITYWDSVVVASSVVIF